MAIKPSVSKSNANLRKQVLITITATLLAFNGWAVIEAKAQTEQESTIQGNPTKKSEVETQPPFTDGERPRQRHSRPGPMPMSHMLDRLDVTDNQRDTVREIIREERNQMHALHTGVEDQIDAERVATRTQTRERLAEVLTDEQLAKYDEMIERTRLARHKKSQQSEAL